MPRLLPVFLLLSMGASVAAAQDGPPCMQDEVHRVFDFWIGDWEVRRPDGGLAGTNRIERILGGCVLVENWSGAGGSAGRSFNYYDPAERAWKQLWVDAAGGHMEYSGSFTDGAMRFEGTNIRPDGSTSRMRMSFTPHDDGAVRQFIEESTDGGKTWSPWFDGTYVRTGG